MSIKSTAWLLEGFKRVSCKHAYCSAAAAALDETDIQALQYALNKIANHLETPNGKLPDAHEIVHDIRVALLKSMAE